MQERGDYEFEQYSKRRWDDVAYATRYGKGCSLREALGLDTQGMSQYVSALDRIVQKENKKS